MNVTTSVRIDKLDDPIDVRLIGEYPHIGFGDRYAFDRFEVTLTPKQADGRGLTPAEQKAWLTNLARQVQLLAASIPDPDEPVPFVPVDKTAEVDVVAITPEVPC